jgi:hypothetical protein
MASPLDYPELCVRDQLNQFFVVRHGCSPIFSPADHDRRARDPPETATESRVLKQRQYLPDGDDRAEALAHGSEGSPQLMVIYAFGGHIAGEGILKVIVEPVGLYASDRIPESLANRR